MNQAFSYSLFRKYCIDALGGCCVNCGSIDNLEIDHIDPSTKKFYISKVWARVTKIELDEELTKCQILCKSCHLYKTSEDLSYERGWAHGTQYGWMKKGCLCNLCLANKRTWHTERNKKRRKGKGQKERF